MKQPKHASKEPKHASETSRWERITAALMLVGFPGWAFGKAADSTWAALQGRLRDQSQVEVILPEGLRGSRGQRDITVDPTSWPGLDNDPHAQALQYGDIYRAVRIALDANGRSLDDASPDLKEKMAEHVLTRTDMYTLADALNRHEDEGLDAVTAEWMRELITMGAENPRPPA